MIKENLRIDPRQHDGMLVHTNIMRQAELGGKEPKRVELRMPEKLYAELVKAAHKNNCSLNALIIHKLTRKKK